MVLDQLAKNRTKVSLDPESHTLEYIKYLRIQKILTLLLFY